MGTALATDVVLGFARSTMSAVLGFEFNLKLEGLPDSDAGGGAGAWQRPFAQTEEGGQERANRGPGALLDMRGVLRFGGRSGAPASFEPEPPALGFWPAMSAGPAGALAGTQ